MKRRVENNNDDNDNDDNDNDDNDDNDNEKPYCAVLLLLPYSLHAHTGNLMMIYVLYLRA